MVESVARTPLPHRPGPSADGGGEAPPQLAVALDAAGSRPRGDFFARLRAKHYDEA